MRDLTGRVEGPEFQLQQILKVQEDNEFRFQQLEGTAPVENPRRQVPTDGVTPSDALPQDQNPVADTSADQLPATPDHAVVAPDLPATDLPMDGSMGDLADPLLQGGTDQLGTLEEGDDFANQPLDLNLGSDVALSSGDAKAQFEACRDAIPGDYAFASDQLTQFLQYYHSDPLAPDAVNYLGEALIQQKDYQVGIAGAGAGLYRLHPVEPRARHYAAPRRGAGRGWGRAISPARTSLLRERYPNTAAAFKERLNQEAQKAQCPTG